MRKFKIGDHVAIYGVTLGDNTMRVGERGRVVELRPADDQAPFLLRIKPDVDPEDNRYAHPKQCRKLINKKLRRLWVDPITLLAYNEPRLCTVEFIEVKKKK